LDDEYAFLFQILTGCIYLTTATFKQSSPRLQGNTSQNDIWSAVDLFNFSHCSLRELNVSSLTVVWPFVRESNSWVCSSLQRKRRFLRTAVLM